ncbi:hypothetical protein [Streptomyces sp. NPDC088748]|uniref:hypothetical protein n=1 Tax=Streptomyces sp. NPDC088748 TaxID=3365887 RepID=UPI0037F76FA9
MLETPARLRACGAPAELRHAVRLLGLAHADRWGTTRTDRATATRDAAAPAHPNARRPRPLLRQR